LQIVDRYASDKNVGRARLALDTNLWSFLAETREGGRFERVARSRGWVIVLPPATILEAARTAEPDLRRRILATMTGGRREHTRSEAALEAQELVGEIRRRRAEWLRPVPRALARAANLDALWMRKIPRLAKYEPEKLAPLSRLTKEDWVRETELAVQRANQQRLRSVDQPPDVLDVSDVWSEPDPRDTEARRGLPTGGRVEAWRFQTAHYYWGQLALDATYGARLDYDTTIADWVEPYVDLHRVRGDREDFNRFFYLDLDRSRMARNWMRWAVPVAQLKFRLGSGNPCDGQQAAYLPDCDFYLTADNRFYLVLNAIAPQAPTKVADVILVPRAASSAVDAILEALA
jgi:hypothetical protein